MMKHLCSDPLALTSPPPNRIDWFVSPQQSSQVRRRVPSQNSLYISHLGFIMASSITHLNGIKLSPLTSLFDMISHTMETIDISYHLWVCSDHISFLLHICSHLVLYAHTHTLPMPLYPPNYPLFVGQWLEEVVPIVDVVKYPLLPRGHMDSRLIAVTENLV
jgi:hypothetical protein